MIFANLSARYQVGDQTQADFCSLCAHGARLDLVIFASRIELDRAVGQFPERDGSERVVLIDASGTCAHAIVTRHPSATLRLVT